MINTFMTCDCCGKTFPSLYYEGGYIDHVENFYGNRDVYLEHNDVEDMARQIVFSGNGVRPEKIARDLLKCFLLWDGFEAKFKEDVLEVVNVFLSELNQATVIATEMEKKLPPAALAILRGEDIDDAFFDMFDRALEEVSRSG